MPLLLWYDVQQNRVTFLDGTRKEEKGIAT